MLAKEISLNIRYRAQLLVGLVLGVWLYFFLVLVGPFDAAELSLSIRTGLMLGYGLVFFLSYALIIPIQNRLFRYLGHWKLSHEVAMVVLFCLYCLPVCFLYYKTEAVNGLYDFETFALTVYLPIIAILMPVIFLGRYLVARDKKEEATEVIPQQTITLLGENKLDILKLRVTDLVAMEAANNYVTVHYLVDGQLQKKLLRSSLRNMHEAVPEMIQVHRSYLVNMHHFIEWKDNLTLGLTQTTVPVSQKYKSTILAASSFVPN
jgi:hypothetical protein